MAGEKEKLILDLDKQIEIFEEKLAGIHLCIGKKIMELEECKELAKSFEGYIRKHTSERACIISSMKEEE